MRRTEIKQGRYYEGTSGIVLKCLDTGEGRFPRIPKFKVIHPFPGQERVMEAREIRRQLSDREVQAYEAVRKAS